MFSTLWYFHVEFLFLFFSFFAPKASFRWQTRLLNTEQPVVSVDAAALEKDLNEGTRQCRNHEIPAPHRQARGADKQTHTVINMTAS